MVPGSRKPSVEHQEENGMDAGWIAFPEASRKANTTPDRAKYWIQLLGINTIKEGRTRYMPVDCLPQLEVMSNLVENGMAPAEAAEQAKNTVSVIPGTEPPIPGNRELAEVGAQSWHDRIQGLEKAVLVMADALKTESQSLRQENQALRADVARLIESNQAMRLSLEPPPLPAELREPPKPVQVWSPPRVIDPGQGMGFIRRAWLELVNPARLRRHLES